MPSSTSSSDPAAPHALSEQEKFFPARGTPAEIRAIRRAIAGLLATMALLLAVSELGARYLYPRVSHLQQRIVSDQRVVESLARDNKAADPRPDPPTVLFVGNSLLLHALDYPKMQEDLAPDARAVRYAIENTEYIDWYYGLRRLFAEGVHPSTVALVLNLGQTLSHGILTDSPRQLFQARDLYAASREAGMDTTQISSLMFSHWSAFYAGREGIRNYILNVSDPAYARELHRLARVPPKFPPEDVMIAQSRARLKRIDQLCRDNGVRFVLVVPPALGERSDLLLKAGAFEGVDVDAPIPMASLGADFFLADRYHLNERGSALFTEALAKDLRSRLAVKAR